MRKYPAKCPKCGEYAEPIFNNNIYNYPGGMTWKTHSNIDPTHWHCDYCDIDFQEDENEII
ncbi:MAG: hypothetical protein PHR06_16305 [Candidatus Cloacimonetes bacterium]|nr:hypothetical protein [Candidatus Cloacimonadota bacterium]